MAVGEGSWGAGRAGTIKRRERDENVREYVRDVLVREPGTRGTGLDVWWEHFEKWQAWRSAWLAGWQRGFSVWSQSGHRPQRGQSNPGSPSPAHKEQKHRTLPPRFCTTHNHLPLASTFIPLSLYLSVNSVTFSLRKKLLASGKNTCHHFNFIFNP